MNTPKNWTPPPEMPANLPPLPMGKNDRKLVYVGMGPLPVLSDGAYYSPEESSWGDMYDGNSNEHYAAESYSKLCRLNQWGDYDPRNKPAEPAKPKTVLDVYRADITAKLAEAAEAVQELRQSLAEWENHHGQLIEASTQLEGGDALSRKAWLEEGMKIQRLHMKKPTVFPKYP